MPHYQVRTKKGSIELDTHDLGAATALWRRLPNGCSVMAYDSRRGWIKIDPLAPPTSLEPNRALARAKLETLAWEQTPEGRRGRSGSRREVLLDTTDGTGMVPLSELTDNQLRRYIGPGRLEEAGDMRKNGREPEPEEAFVEKLQSMLDIGDRQIYFRLSTASHQAFVQFYNIPYGVAASSAEGENNRLMLTVVDAGTDKVKVELTVRGPSFGESYKLRSKTASTRKAAEYVAELLNRAAKKAPYGHAFNNYEKNPMRKNSRRPKDSRGLHEDEWLLRQFVEMAAESMELKNVRDAEVTPEVIEMAHRYDLSLHTALEALARKYPPENGASAEDLWNANAPYLVLMTLRGKGVGIWDGDWDDFYADTDKAQDFLKKALSHYADGSGSGSLEEAFMTAACETVGGCKEYDEDFKPNSRREEPDEVAARELSLYIENEYSLVGEPNSQGKAIEKNLLGHLRRGNFDLKKAEIAYMHLMETGAKKYAKEFGSSEKDWPQIFNKPTRELVAHEFATSFAAEHKGS